MYQKFSDAARQAIAVAQEEAEKAGRMVISTEHILLGLSRDETSIAAKVLSELGVGTAAIEGEIKKLEPDPVGKKPRSKMILSRDAKRALDATYREAVDMNDSVVGPGHLLLGLIVQGGAASTILGALSVDIEKVRHALSAMPKSEETATVEASG
jgi:ATP-dependent Clp protease ATP-binding subunit ClpC